MLDFDDKRLILVAGGGRTPMQVGAGAAAMHRNPAPGAEMINQCLYGEPVLVCHHDGEFALVQALVDRYVGWVLQVDLSKQVLPVTHRVRALRAHIYTEASIKAAPLRVVSLGAQIASDGVREGRFLKCRAGGWVIEDQLLPVDEYETDPAAAAQRYLNTPYLWGGRDSAPDWCNKGFRLAGFHCRVIATCRARGLARRLRTGRRRASWRAMTWCSGMAMSGSCLTRKPCYMPMRTIWPSPQSLCPKRSGELPALMGSQPARAGLTCHLRPDKSRTGWSFRV